MVYFFLIAPYFLLIVSFILGWLRKPSSLNSFNRSSIFISVLIPVRNEVENIPALISCLDSQTYPRELFEVIFIDDHSTDGTYKCIYNYRNIDTQYKLISLPDHVNGKKKALWRGVEASSGDFIMTTDGDCAFGPRWIELMADCFVQNPQSLIIGPVFLKDQRGILGQFQCLEFMSLIASGAGAAGIGHPILCNGANLAAPKSMFYEAADVYKAEVQSGDDIFLLLELKRKGFEAVFCRNNEAVVETETKKKLGDFIEQRSRWTFKSRYYRDLDIIAVAIIVLATNLLFPISFVFALFNPYFFLDIIILFILKCFVDFILLFLVADFFHRKKWLSFFVIHQLVYIFYVSWVGIFGHLSTFSWKSRSQISGKG